MKLMVHQQEKSANKLLLNTAARGLLSRNLKHNCGDKANRHVRIWVQKDIPALGASSGRQNLGTEGFQRREEKGGIGTMVEFHWQAETEWGLEWKAELKLKEEKADCSRISGTSAEARSGAARNGATRQDSI